MKLLYLSLESNLENLSFALGRLADKSPVIFYLRKLRREEKTATIELNGKVKGIC